MIRNEFDYRDGWWWIGNNVTQSPINPVCWSLWSHCVYMLSTWTNVGQNLKMPDSLLSIVVIRYFNLTLNRNLATSSKNELPFNYYLFFWEHISVIEYIHWGQLQNRRSLIYNTSRTLYITRTSLFLFIVASLKLIADNLGVTDRIHPMIIFDLIFQSIQSVVIRNHIYWCVKIPSTNSDNPYCCNQSIEI